MELGVNVIFVYQNLVQKRNNRAIKKRGEFLWKSQCTVSINFVDIILIYCEIKVMLIYHLRLSTNRLVIQDFL